MRRTHDKPLLLQALLLRVVLGYDEHALNACARPLLAEHHLQDRRVDRFARNLLSELVQLPVRDLKIRRGVFVLFISI